MTKLYLASIAAEGAASGLLTDAMKTAFETGLNSVRVDVFDMMGVALPIGIGIAGVLIAVRLGFSFFRSITH